MQGAVLCTGRKQQPPALEAMETYTVEETARILRIGRNSAYDAIRAGAIPALRIGRRIVVPRVALDRLLAAGTPKPRSVLVESLSTERSQPRKLDTEREAAQEAGYARGGRPEGDMPARDTSPRSTLVER
jgi:excisionase family DNA binding protein